MATIKAFTSLEQSKKLADILPLESADMCYFPVQSIENNVHYNLFAHKEKAGFPAWSLAALLGVLPEKYTELIKEGGMYRIIIKDSYMTSLFNNPVDACVAIIEKLNELNLL